MQTLKQGSTGSDVKSWQSIVGTSIDGQFGPATTAATKAWQTKNGITPDGIVGELSWSVATGYPPELVASTPAPPPKASAAKPVTKLSFPTTGKGVVTSLTPASMWGVPRSVWMLGAVGGLFVGFHFHSKKLAR